MGVRVIGIIRRRARAVIRVGLGCRRGLGRGGRPISLGLCGSSSCSVGIYGFGR